LGANSYCANLTSLPVFKRVKIILAVDKNHLLHGRVTAGARVVAPHVFEKDVPIVITSVLAIDSIKRGIAALGLKNRVVSIQREDFV